MAARIASLTAHLVVLPLRREVRHASHARTVTENIIVKCTLADGTVGWGEGVPREYVTGETADASLDLLKDTDLSKQLPPCADFAAAMRLAEALQLQPVPDDDRHCVGNAARCALELAILDAFGRAFGESLTNVTELVAPKAYGFRQRVQYSGAITSSRRLKLRAACLGYRLTGFAQIKVKVGIDGHDDSVRLRTIRRWAGKLMRLRVDANEAWSAKECPDRFAALAPIGVECIEQPLRHADVAELAAIRKNVSAPIMLDESLCSMIDASRAAEGGWCDRFNIRLSKCGGYIPSLRLAEFAKLKGMTYQLGCQVGESAILTAAGRHFATSVRGLTAIEGSFDRHLMRETLAFEDLTFGRGGWANALSGSGHGAWVDADAVEECSRRTEVLRV